VAEVPRTKAGKQRKVAKTMGEFQQGTLRSSSGRKVTNPEQAVAIALNQTGQSKPPSQRRRSSPNDRDGPGMGERNGRLACEISRRVDEGQSRARR